MEKIRREDYKLTRTIHEFYCDDCKSKIGESLEYDDGYYNQMGEYKQSICLGSSVWYKLHLCLCDQCSTLRTQNIISTLKELGFEEN